MFKLNGFRFPVWEANICIVMFYHPFVCKIFYIMQWENNYIMQKIDNHGFDSKF